MIPYAIIFSLCSNVAAIASGILRKGAVVLSMGWADKRAGAALGVVTGGIISAAVIMGMANLTDRSETGDNLPGKILNSTLETEMAKRWLEDSPNQLALAGILFDEVDIVPATKMWFVPSNFTNGLVVLELRQKSIGE